MSIAAGGRHEALFLSLLHIMLGSAMLVPWESRWQLGLGMLSVGALLANTMLAHQVDPNLLYHWLGVITAACLSQCATSFGVRYRERTQQYKALRERDLQLGESEEKFRRVFETSPTRSSSPGPSTATSSTSTASSPTAPATAAKK